MTTQRDRPVRAQTSVTPVKSVQAVSTSFTPPLSTPSSLLTSELSPDVGAVKWIDASNPSAARWERVNPLPSATGQFKPTTESSVGALDTAHLNVERQIKRLLMFGALTAFFNALLASTVLLQVSTTNQVMVAGVLISSFITIIAGRKTLSSLNALKRVGAEHRD